MHQLCLDVMGKFIMVWMRGNHAVKMSVAHVETVSKKLVEHKPFILSTFVRKPGSLMEIDRWKATEFRQFLLYTGKISFSRQ